MVVASEQKLIIKRTFLEFSVTKPSRQRSQTDPVVGLDLQYGELRDFIHGSAVSGIDVVDEAESCSMNASLTNVKSALLFLATPEAAPMPCPSQHVAFSQPQDEWSGEECLPAAAYCGQDISSYECSSWQNSTDSYWAPIPYNANMGYDNSFIYDQCPAQCIASDWIQSSALVRELHEKAPEVMVPCPIKEIPIRENRVFCDDDSKAANETRTTIMLRGLPQTYTRSAVLELLEQHGFFGRFNFVYVPIDFKRCSNLGYGLVNLVSPAEALRLGRQLEGFSSWTASSDSTCTVDWCTPHQGLQPNVERYKNSPVMHESVPDEWRPLLLAHGVPIAFPPATMKIKAPRLKGMQ